MPAVFMGEQKDSMASGETERRQEDGVGEDHVRPLNHYRNFEL
jgi:hypothetical protein